MATDQHYVEHICEQANLPGALSYKKMFGEYALYLDGKVVALVCDNQLFIKPTDDGRKILGTPAEHPPYPGAKPHFRVDAEIDDRERLKKLFLATARALPAPKPKTKKAKTKRS
jgi:TfoX/Sxy family transcriptional regulator of competence genes